MSRILSFGLASLVLASSAIAMPVFAMADEGGGGAAPAQTYDLATALGMLNPDTATDWNRGGQPSVERLQALTGNKTLTRANIAEAAPDLDRERAPKIAAAPEPAKATSSTAAPATSTVATDDDMPTWARELFDKVNSLTERNAELEDLLTEQGEFRTSAAEAVFEPPAAPTTLARAPEGAGYSPGVAQPMPPPASLHARVMRRWPGARRNADGKPILLDNEPVIAIAVGQYPAQPGQIRRVGEAFNYSGVPGSWFVPANDADLPLYLDGRLTQEDAARKWGLRAEMSADHL